MDFEPHKLKKKIKLPKGEFVLAPPLLALYSNDSNYMVIMKGAQGGITTFAFISEILYARFYKFPLTIIHAFPTIELSKMQTERFDQLLRLNSHWIGEAKGSKHIKKIKNKPTSLNSIIIVTGVSTEKSGSVIATDADFIVTDEFDRAVDPDLVKEFEARTLASELGKKLLISVPYAGQGYGISVRFLESTRNYWHVKCKSCGKEVPLMDKFWEIDEEPPYFVCPECGDPLDPDDPEAVEVRASGFYKPLNPSAKVEGYHISRLLYPHEKLARLTKEYPDASESFWYTWIGGFPSEEETIIAPRIELTQGEFNGPAYLGIDVAFSNYVIAIAVDSDQGFVIRDIVYASPTEAEQELVSILEKYPVQGIICDSAPERIRSQEILSLFDIPYNFVKYGSFKSPDWLVFKRDVYLVEKWEALRRFILGVKTKEILFHVRASVAAEQVAELRPIKLNQVYTWKEAGRSDEMHASVYAWLAKEIFSNERASGVWESNEIEIFDIL